MSVLAVLFVIRFVPETKGRSLEAIQHLWKPGSEEPHAAPADLRPAADRV
jgi:hypothetical protein